jgi:hypothetical protein
MKLLGSRKDPLVGSQKILIADAFGCENPKRLGRIIQNLFFERPTHAEFKIKK